MHRFSLYLAGPQVFLPDPVAAGRHLKALAATHGLDGLFPLDNSLDLDGLDKPTQGLNIKEANCALIRACDGVIADLSPFRGPGMDQGTAYEIGFAEALGKPIWLYSSERGPYADRVARMMATSRKEDGTLWDTQGMQVEDFDLADNLMLAAGRIIHRDAAAAIEAAAAYFSAR